MDDHYRTLGLNSSATADEIRRAYRILARRYHPDVNLEADSGEKFKSIAEAYRTLSDKKKRKQYDVEYEKHLKRTAHARYRAYTDQAREDFLKTSAKRKKAAAAQRRTQTETKSSPTSSAQRRSTSAKPEPLQSGFAQATKSFRNLLNSRLQLRIPKPRKKVSQGRITQVSILEVSVSTRDAIFGVKKTIEISEDGNSRKISVVIPAGVRTGSVVRLRNKSTAGEELVLMIQVASHPFLSIEKKGVVVEVPITVQEAVCGASLTVPTFESPVVLKIPPGSQSGNELRLRDRGIADRSGVKGDLFYRLSIQIPEKQDSAVIQKATELAEHYGDVVRQGLPNSLDDA